MSNLDQYLPSHERRHFLENIGRYYRDWCIRFPEVERVEQKWDGLEIHEYNVSDFLVDLFYAYPPESQMRRNIHKIKENDPADVADCLNTARNARNIGKALSIINDIHGLGISYGSKSLRLLRPEGDVVVFDTIMARVTGYGRSGYSKYYFDCCHLQKEIRNYHGGRVRLCDIEAAMYQYFNP